MVYFVTGGTGFIGKRLVRKLLGRPGSSVHLLVREQELERLPDLREFWGQDEVRVTPIVGDLTQPLLGLSDAQIHDLRGRVAHFFHLAAIYDLKASAQAQQAANVEGTRNAVRCAEALEAGHFHLFSSIAAAGLYEGVFREDMFEEAENLDHPYFRTKHDSERIVRRECKVPWRVFRPGLAVGDSRTGEMDKVDGPYYFFKPIQKLRRMLPPWMPTIGIEGGRINIVPVDFVVDATDHIAHLDGHDGECFHLVDPAPMRVGDVLNVFAKAAHAPDMAFRVNAALIGFVPASVRRSLMALTPVRRIRGALMEEFGLPEHLLEFVNYPTRFDCREAQRLLKGTGITVPPLQDYAWRLWDYWERHLDPDLFIDRTLRGQVEGKVVLITGASSGIGKATARRLAQAGAITLTCARDEARLAETRQAFAEEGLSLGTYAVDLADYDRCDAFVRQLTEEHGGVDILVNNAGRSIRRAIENSFERFHDFERTMQLNYFGALRLTMGLLPAMVSKGKGHVVNISSIGVLTNAPHFSAYVASKAALDAFSRCAASEFADRGVEFTTINMPLVRTPMTAPTKIYDSVPTLTPEEAAELVVDAIVHKPERIATRLGIFGQVLYAVAPKVAQVIMNTAFRMFPDTSALERREGALPPPPTADQVAFSQLMRGIHL